MGMDEARGVDPDQVMRRCARRIVPLVLFGFFLCYLDRTNIGMAALTMNADLGLSPRLFGMAVGMFFWGYCLFEVPSNIALKRFGARVWLARIMVVWGLASLAMAWAWNAQSLFVMRFILGAAEAGFVPGVIYYFRSWFPEGYNNRVIGMFLVANPVSSVIGNPISGLLLQLDGLFGLHGWQVLFIVESIPTVLFGFVIYFMLPETPREVGWLAPAEKQWLEGTLERERSARQGIRAESILGTLLNGRLWLLSLTYLGIVIAIYAAGYFMPQIVREFGVSTRTVGFISAIPPLFGAIAMVLWSRHSDKTGERAWHAAIGCLTAMVGLVVVAQAPTPAVSIVGFTLVSMGTLSGMVTFWAMPNALITGGQAAAAFALVNTIASLGGVIGPNMMGYLRESTGDFRSGLLAAAACQIVGVAIVLYFRRVLNASRERRADGAGIGAPEPAGRRT